MDGAVLQVLVQTGKELCVFSFLLCTLYKVISRWVLFRFAFKVVFKLSMRTGKDRKLTRTRPPQLLLTSAHFMWVYDYFLTFGDEVQYPHIFCDYMSSSDRYTDKICLVWNGILE